ncbi:MAG TPA: ABC transporter substrate-binding protein [Burkholderiales bacterium]|jgi:branched-chain amino acid transport system substrate-binding protein|nr:ABC transporter substrate-binding protein [Burkholderiales bacterium]
MRTLCIRVLAVLALGFATPGFAADPIVVGLVDEVTGPQAEAGVLTAQGARLAVEEINAAGGILGRPVELQIEDNQSTNPGTVLAYSKLVSQKVVAVLGPLRSTQVQAASPTIAKARIPAVIGGSDPSLTRVNNPWIFRVRPNDLYSSRVMAEFGVKELKAKKWAIIHSTDTFGTGGKNALVDALKALGVEPVLVQGYTNNSQDFTPIVLAVKKSGADVIGSYMTNSPDVGIFARQLRQLGMNVPWIGSTSIVTETAIRLAGEALHGTYGVSDFVVDANEESRRFAAAYRKKHGMEPDLYSAWCYGGMYLLKHAIEAAKSTDPEKVRAAMLAIKGLKGVEGTYNFNANGDGVHGYNIVRNDKGRVAFIKHIEFDD